MFFLLFLSTLFTGLKAQEYITDNPFETMIRLGSMNVKNPIYQMPSGQAGSAYIVSAITSGDAVRYPLGYTVASTPDRHFIQAWEKCESSHMEELWSTVEDRANTVIQTAKAKSHREER